MIWGKKIARFVCSPWILGGLVASVSMAIIGYTYIQIWVDVNPLRTLAYLITISFVFINVVGWAIEPDWPHISENQALRDLELKEIKKDNPAKPKDSRLIVEVLEFLEEERKNQNKVDS